MKQNDTRQNFKMSYDEALLNSKPAVITKDTKVKFIDIDGDKQWKEVTLFKGETVAYLMTVRRSALVSSPKTNHHVVHLALHKLDFMEEK